MLEDDRLMKLQGHLNDATLAPLLDTALERRSDILPPNTNAYRLVNSTGDAIPGLFVDVYGEYAVCQIETPRMEQLKDVLIDWLCTHLNLRGIFAKHNTLLARSNGLHGNGVIWGEVPETISCTELGVRLLVDPKMAKTGYFLDLRECRDFVQSVSRGAKVLNCFAFTCSIGVFACRGGAQEVVNVERSENALLLGQKIYQANKQQVAPSSFVCSDIWKYLDTEVGRKSEYDVVVIDPPEYAARETEATKAVDRYLRLNTIGLKLVRSGGIIITSCCSHGLSRVTFLNVILQSCRLLGVTTDRLWGSVAPADHPVSEKDPSLDYLHIVGMRVHKK